MKINQLFEQEYSTEEFKSRFSDITLYHGSYSGTPKFIKFRKRDAPKNTFKPFHYAIDELSYQKFGVHIRSGMFLTQSEGIARKYGPPEIIVPCDGFRMFASNQYHDMTVELNIFPMNIRSYLNDAIISAQTKDNDDSSDMLRAVTKLVAHFEEHDFNYIKEHLGEELSKMLTIIGFEGNGQEIADQFVNHYSKLMKKYVDSVFEIKDKSDIEGIHVKSEIMVYSPNGFVVEV